MASVWGHRLVAWGVCAIGFNTTHNNQKVNELEDWWKEERNKEKEKKRRGKEIQT